ncbi:CAP domain-containing protein [Aquisphaera insulae]|uniref:CAP domain-containing protein n=1 Tax=Aquisphaera insulae TaxID=2712864 RepID=UPI0013EA6054|nr:CAP domain-containing protein [Aquisphaera insulae]
MSRPRTHRSLRFDSLESRELLSGMTAPTAEQQYALSLINRARMNPAATAEQISNGVTPDLQSTLSYYHVDLNATAQAIASTPAKPPLAWNSDLATAAQGHSQDMVNNQYQSHTGSDGSTAEQRMKQAGYTGASSTGENAYAYADSVDQAMQAFLIDWGVSDQGHRRNLLQGNVSSADAYREVGIGIASTSASSKVGPLVITQDFGSQASDKAQLLGIAYNDSDNSGTYGIGEGQGNVQVDATNLSTGKTTSVQTWSAGGYQMALDPGSYQVTSSVNGKVVKSVAVTIGTDNVEQDFLLNQTWDGRSRDAVISSLTTPPTPAPAPVVQTTVAPVVQTTAAPVVQTTAAPVTLFIPTAAKTVSIPVAKPFATAKATSTPSFTGSWTSWTAQKA